MSQKWVVVPWEQYQSPQPQTGGLVQRTSGLSRDSVLAAIPKHSRRDAQAILQHIERAPDIAWDDKGQLVVKGETVLRSHITDLLKDAFYKYKNWEAEGASTFYRALAESNLPAGLVHNPERRALLERYKHPQPPGILASSWLSWR